MFVQVEENLGVMMNDWIIVAEGGCAAMEEPHTGEQTDALEIFKILYFDCYTPYTFLNSKYAG